MKTSELTGAALDWAVAKCEGFDTRNNCEVEFVNPQDRITVMSFACMADEVCIKNGLTKWVFKDEI